MPENDDFDFGPLDDNQGTEDFNFDDNLFTFEDFSGENDSSTDDQKTVKNLEEYKKKRTSEDFEPDMDALLLTAQSSMIVEGMKYLSMKDYTSKRLKNYIEAIQGVDLYIKIIQRDPNNYRKLSKIINEDIDCKEVEKIAFNLYKTKFSEPPETDEQKRKAYEIFREKLKQGYDKTSISSAMVHIKKYFLLSGGLDEEKLNQLIQSNDNQLKKEISQLNQLVKMAVELLKKGKGEIAKGMKGKDVNIFIIKASQILEYYYKMIHNKEASNYYSRVFNTYKRYFIIRE